jgi:hypothetical protein
MNNDIDDLLKQALTPTEEPDFWVNQKIINSMNQKGSQTMKKFKKIPVLLGLTCALCVGATTAYAAYHYLSPATVAKKMDNNKLSDAFKGKQSIEINQTQHFKDYDITLLGITSGKNLSQYFKDNKLVSERTYSVVAIKTTDNKTLSKDEWYEKNFLVSPYIQGFEPWKVNAFTLDGGYEQFVEDNTLYRITECDNIEKFADHTIYLGISDTTFFEKDAFTYDEKTGNIARNEKYDGVNALFTLPIDKSKANAKEVKQFMKELEKTDSKTEEDSTDSTDTSIKEWVAKITPENIDQYADVIKDSVQTVTPKDGEARYSYEDKKAGRKTMGSVYTKYDFKDNKIGMSEHFNYSYDETGLSSLWLETYCLNKDGTVTVAIYTPKQ